MAGVVEVDLGRKAKPEATAVANGVVNDDCATVALSKAGFEAITNANGESRMGLFVVVLFVVDEADELEEENAMDIEALLPVWGPTELIFVIGLLRAVYLERFEEDGDLSDS